GALAATLWPWDYRHKTSGTAMMLPHGNDVANSGNVADNALTAGEVTKIDLSPVSLNPAGVNPGGLNTLNLSPANLNTTHPTPIMVKPAAAEPPSQGAPPAQPPAQVTQQVAQDACHNDPSKPHIVMSLQRTMLRFDEPASLGLTVDGTADGAHLII